MRREFAGTRVELRVMMVNHGLLRRTVSVVVPERDPQIGTRVRLRDLPQSVRGSVNRSTGLTAEVDLSKPRLTADNIRNIQVAPDESQRSLPQENTLTRI